MKLLLVTIHKGKLDVITTDLHMPCHIQIPKTLPAKPQMTKVIDCAKMKIVNSNTYYNSNFCVLFLCLNRDKTQLIAKWKGKNVYKGPVWNRIIKGNIFEYIIQSIEDAGALQ